MFGLLKNIIPYKFFNLIIFVVIITIVRIILIQLSSN